MTESERLTKRATVLKHAFSSYPEMEITDRLAEYEDIGTVEEFKALKEKAEPKNAFVEGSYLLDDVRYLCPKCKERLYTEHFDVGYCNCGQAVK